MKILTILNHGTVNSSANTDLVINKLAESMGGAEGHDWILNEGAGTDELFEREHPSAGHTGWLAKKAEQAKSALPKIGNALSGIVAGKGVEANVARAVRFVTEQQARVGANLSVQVNLAGHSRGSVTCYKIARALHQAEATRDVRVNIFAIDPVPGNMGTLNQANYRDIALGGNLDNTVLMLAESEHRLAFRPYVDALYSMGLPDHKLETIPGTHGGINELAGAETEAAHIVMSRAMEFLQANGSTLKSWSDMWLLGDGGKLETYAKLMRKIKKYQGHASMLNLGNLFTAGLQVDRERTAMVHGPKQTWGTGAHALPDHTAPQLQRGDHRGLKLNEALSRGQTLPNHQTAHATRPNRFFANLEHQSLFIEAYPEVADNFLRLERGVTREKQEAIARVMPDRFAAASATMSMPEREYCAHWLAKRGCPVELR